MNSVIATPFEGFTQFGLNGLIIGTLFATVYFLIKMHSTERQEWIQAYKEVAMSMDIAYKDVARIMDDRQRETNALLARFVDKIH